MRPEVEAKLRHLIDFAEVHGLTELTWAEEGVKISFRCGVPRVEEAEESEEASAEPVVPAIQEEIIKSPMVGTFRRSNGKDRPPMSVDGDHVKVGDRLAIVECMKIPTEVVSFCEGQIRKILVEDGSPVEYGQPLFAVTPASAAVEEEREVVGAGRG